MESQLTWDEAKRRANVRKHGLDFANAGWVLDSRWRMDVPEARNAVVRIRSISYALGCWQCSLWCIPRAAPPQGKPRRVSSVLAVPKKR